MSFLTVIQDLDIECHYEKTLVKLKSYSGHQIPTKGVVTLPCEYKGKVFHVKFHVIEIEAPSVLSAQTCKEMGLLARIHSLQQHNIPECPTDLDQSILVEYSDLFQGLGCLPGEHTIKLDPSVPPVVHPPRKVPVSLKEKIKDELDRMEKAGVIVRQTEPTDWVNSMVAVVKPNKIRICIDPRDLNAAIRREHFPMTTIEEVVASMPQAKVFSVLDATSGYWQVKLDEESSKLCTFNTPFGRYRFTRLPFGIKSAPEVFQNCMSELFADVDGVKVIVDDLLIWGKDDDEHDARLKQVLDRARKVNLKFNAKKCRIRQEEVPYVGHVLSKDGLKPDPEKIRAVQEMKPPQNTKELKTFLGFIQYLGKFMPNMATVSAPLRELLEKNIAWHWDQEQEASFERLKQMASSTPVLGYYDPSKPLTLSVDASSKGLGAVLLQDGKPLAYASRALTPTQERYAQIEKETLAIVYGAQKFHQFIYGRPTRVESDHKPLQYILSKPLHQAPLRLQKMMLTLQRYDLKVKYLPGSELSVADALSRSYLQETTETLIPDLEVNEVHLTAHLPISPEKYAEFQKATADDPTMQALRSVVLNGWPGNKEELPGNVREYWCYRDEISSVDGLLFKAQKLIVPQSMRKEMLDRIHESHQGIVKCKQRARDILFWPGMSSQIEDKVSKCSVCNQFQRAQPREPMIIHEPPDRPWSKIGCDLFEFNGVHYLLSVDYYSKWIEVAKLDDITSSNIICHLKSQFARYGIPDELISDNGPQYACSAFNDFSRSYGFVHTTSSPLYPQSNGEVERAVQTIENFLKKGQDPYKALLNYRNTPLDGIGLSPAQILMGRRLKTSLPTSAELLKPQGTPEIKQHLQKIKERQKFYYDKHCSKELPPLDKGDQVSLKHEKHHTPRSYIVQAPGGQKYRRNCRHLNKNRVSQALNKGTVETSQNGQASSPACNQTNLNGSFHETETLSEHALKPAMRTRSGRLVKQPTYLKDYAQ